MGSTSSSQVVRDQEGPQKFNKFQNNAYPGPQKGIREQHFPPSSFSHYLPPTPTQPPTPSALIRGHRGADVSIYLSVLTEYLNTWTDRAASPSDQ